MYISTAAEDDWVVAQALRSHELVQGFVPVGSITLGVPKASNLPIETQELTGPTLNVPPVPRPAKLTVLASTVYGLWDRISQERVRISIATGLSADHPDTLIGNASNIGQFPGIFLKYLLPEARSIMDTGNFDPLEFCSDSRNLLQPGSRFPKAPGVYLRIYRNMRGFNYAIFEQKPKPSTGLYGGKVQTSWSSRASWYREDEKKANSPHFRMARTCAKGDIFWIPILLITDIHDPNIARAGGFAKALCAAELTVVCLFRSWLPLFAKPLGAGLVGAFGADFVSSHTFETLITEVSATTRWNPRPIYGLNWQTPGTTIFDVKSEAVQRMVYFSWKDMKTGLTIFRIRRPLHYNTNRWFVELIDVVRLHVQPQVAQEAGLKHGQMLNIVFELDESGKDHDSMWIRLPRYGPNPVFDILRGFAIRIEWVDDAGVWKGSWLYKTHLIPKRPKTAPYSDSYRLAISILTRLQQISYTGLPEGMENMDPFRVAVMRMEYDHLQQRSSVRRVEAVTRPWPADRTMQDNFLLLDRHIRAHNLQNRITLGANFLPMKYRTRQCVLLPYGSKAASMRTADNMQCVGACVELHRPCVWYSGTQTDFETLMFQDEAFRPLGILPFIIRRMTGSSLIHTLPNLPFDPTLDQDNLDEQQESDTA